MDDTVDLVAARSSKASRLAYIAELVNREGFVSVDVLAAELEVSRMTVHRDLDSLQRDRVLRKVRGGASAQRSTQYESDLAFRSHVAIPEKRRIAAAAARLVDDGAVVILDDSTTALEIIPHLEAVAPLTVITNFLPAVQRITAIPSISLIGLGGDFMPRHQSFGGVVCVRILADLHADIAFVSLSAMNGTEVYHQEQGIVDTKLAMVRAADTRVLLMDHTKVGQSALYRVCSTSDFTHVIVDAGVDEHTRQIISESGVTLIVA